MFILAPRSLLENCFLPTESVPRTAGWYGVSVCPDIRVLGLISSLTTPEDLRTWLDSANLWLVNSSGRDQPGEKQEPRLMKFLFIKEIKEIKEILVFCCGSRDSLQGTNDNVELQSIGSVDWEMDQIGFSIVGSFVFWKLTVRCSTFYSYPNQMRILRMQIVGCSAVLLFYASKWSRTI